MTDADRVFPSTNDGSAHLVSIQPSQLICKSIKATLKKTLDDLLRQFKNESPFRRVVFFLVQLLPILGWAPRYNLQCFKADLIAGIIIASVAIPQGISYDNLLNLPSILGLCECYYLKYEIELKTVWLPLRAGFLMIIARKIWFSHNSYLPFLSFHSLSVSFLFFGMAFFFFFFLFNSRQPNRV